MKARVRDDFVPGQSLTFLCRSLEHNWCRWRRMFLSSHKADPAVHSRKPLTRQVGDFKIAAFGKAIGCALCSHQLHSIITRQPCGGEQSPSELDFGELLIAAILKSLHVLVQNLIVRRP